MSVEISVSYRRGYRDAVNNLSTSHPGLDSPTESAAADATAASGNREDDSAAEWGLHVTGVLKSAYSGNGVRLAALVDGLDTSHPDWNGRSVVMKSFVPGEAADVAGSSGTHYLGTACGTLNPAAGPRYGCAPASALYVAKVLSRTGTGSQAGLLAGLDWAIANNCRVILVPIGWTGPANPFEQLAARAAARGALVIAGAGHNARRSEGHPGQVMSPAACPSVMAVGCVDSQIRLPDWTPRAAPILGGVIDLVAPGVNLRSSLPTPQRYGTLSGSATAAAYVAGIAALWAQARPKASAHELWQALTAHARRLPFAPLDVGAGLVQAP